MHAIARNLVHVTVVLIAPPLLLGVINKVKAFFAGRTGPRLLQPYYDIIKLFQKGSVISETTTWVFLAGPPIALATAITASLLVPLGGSAAPISFVGDLILAAYVLGLGRFFTALAALDTGSSFEGMGASREVTFACLAEPAFFLGLATIAKLTGSLSLSGMFGPALAPFWGTSGASLALVFVGWFIVALVENSRIPFDDPNTHLELTMIHEVMVLDHGGPALGMILYGAAIKLFVFAALLVRLATPIATGWVIVDWSLFAIGMSAVAVMIGVIESVTARLRLSHIPVLLVAACLLCGFGLILLAR